MDLRELKQRMPTQSWADVKRKVYRHTRGVGMGDYIKLQRPNEPKDVVEFRVKRLNLLTKDVFRKGLNNALRMLLESPLTVDGNEEVLDFIKKDNFDTHSGWVDLYTKIVWYLQNIVEDPNGILVVMPISLGEELNPQNTPTNERVYFYIDYIPSDEVIYYSTDMAIYKWRGQLFKDDKENIFLLKERNGGYDAELWYNHNTGHKLSTHLGGYQSSDEYGKPYFDSFFDGAVEFADGFVNQYENLKAELLQNSFPIRVIQEMPCNSCKGKGVVHDKESKTYQKECDSCNGSGKITNFNPNTLISRPRKDSLTESDKQHPFLEYYSPPMNGTQLNYDFSFDLYNRAGESIGATITKIAQSGVAKEEDKESYYSMLSQIQNNIIRLYQFSISSIQSIWVLDTETPIKVQSKKDIRYNIQDYTKKVIDNLRESGVPEAVVSTHVSELVERTTNEVEAKIIRLMPKVDILYGMETQDIVMFKSMSGSPVNDYALYVHLNSFIIFKELEFEDKQDDEILNEFKELARLKFEEYRNLNPIMLNEFE